MTSFKYKMMIINKGGSLAVVVDQTVGTPSLSPVCD